MISVATTRFVFDRKKTASREKKGLVQIEILYRGRRKWISTGVKLYRDQWTDKSHAVKCPESIEYNRRLDGMKSVIDGYITSIMEARREFDFDTFNRWYAAENERKRSFVEWLAAFIA